MSSRRRLHSSCWRARARHVTATDDALGALSNGRAAGGGRSCSGALRVVARSTVPRHAGALRSAEGRGVAGVGSRGGAAWLWSVPCRERRWTSRDMSRDHGARGYNTR